MQVRRDCGFSITEVLATIALMSILAAMGVPMVLSGMDTMKLNGVVRSIQGELQSARLKAVSANRAMRVRFDCPAAGQYRMVELLGSPASPDGRDSGVARCSPTTYPYPPASMNSLSRPNHDGPLRYLNSGMTFTSAPTVEFWPDGTAHADAGSGNPWPAIAGSGVSVTVSYKSRLKTITVNGVGKVQLVQ